MHKDLLWKGKILLKVVHGTINATIEPFFKSVEGKINHKKDENNRERNSRKANDDQKKERESESASTPH